MDKRKPSPSLLLGSLALAAGLSGCSTSIGSDNRETMRSAQTAPMPGDLPVVLTLQATLDQRVDPVDFATRLTSQPEVARITLDNDTQSETSIVLVFSDRAEYARWHSERAVQLRALLGEGATYQQVSVKDMSLLEMARMAKGSMVAEHVSVVYDNSGETADGDADIDAITAICADGAICKPSN